MARDHFDTRRISRRGLGGLSRSRPSIGSHSTSPSPCPLSASLSTSFYSTPARVICRGRSGTIESAAFQVPVEKSDTALSDKTEHPPVPDAFAALGVRPSILRALAEAKFTKPSEIQALLIPRALAGVDLLGQARTGTGKTAAFAIPILQNCDKGAATQAIILVPTRELAVQVDAEIQRLAEFTPIRSVPVYGGQKIM